MSSTPARKQRPLIVENLESRENPSGWQIETFDTTAVGALPTGWAQWSTSSTAYAASSVRPYAGPTGLAANAASNVTARAWQTNQSPADTAVSTNLYADSLIPTEVMARGQNLGGTTPTFYSASVVRGVTFQLMKTVGGARTVLGTVISSNYVSSVWLKLTLQPVGNQIQAELYNAATGLYLNSTGQWQTSQEFAISVADSAIPSPGLIGINRPAQYAGTVSLDNFAWNQPVANNTETFDSTGTGLLPTGWTQYVEGDNTFGVTAGPTGGSNNVLTSGGTTAQRAFAWVDSPAAGSNADVTTSVYLNSATPALVLARGSNLASATPTYYGVQVSSGLQLQLLRTVNGSATVLAASATLRDLTNVWVRVTLRVQGDQVKVRVVRLDTNQSLSSRAGWTNDAVWFREVSDAAISTGQYAGVGRDRVAGSVTFDDFTVVTPTGDNIVPTVALTVPTGTVTGTVVIAATASDNVGVSRVEFWLDGSLKASLATTPFNWNFDSKSVPNGNHNLSVKAFDAAGNVGVALATLTVQNATTGGGTINSPPPSAPSIPQHYSHIRIAELAYTGTPMTSFETGLLGSSVDLVIPNPTFLGPIQAAAPNTPQLIYTNVSNLYEGLLTDWLNYADAHNLDRELAFYHVAQATNFSGSSPSSPPVNWLWSVKNGSTDLTSQARNNTSAGDVSLGGAAGAVLYLGYPEKFRELNFSIVTPAANGWSGVFEYATAVDASGNPTTWATLTPTSNGTANFTQSGRVTFDPPANWKPMVNGGTARLFYVRLRTVTAGTSPVASAIFGRDYVNANGAITGVIPAFDSSVDANGDGYLSDAEFANHAAGKDARFRYETRLFYPAYGQMRFATNPSSQGVKDWAADYHVRTLASQPLADGFFVDNSNGKTPIESAVTLESAANYSTELGQLLQAVGGAIAPKWLIANTTGGGTYTDEIVKRVPASMEEFSLRPLSATWSRFFDIAGLVASRLSQANSPYLVIDSHPQGGDATDPRTQMATLAYYYLLGDPVRTFLMFYGGYEPGTSWTRHWVPAAAYNIGQPTGTWTEFATGNDPANAALTYKVFSRNYGNNLVLYKPLSYKSGVGTGTTADNTVTTHQLSGTYRALQANGTLRAPITSITLRNGEGAVLIRV